MPEGPEIRRIADRLAPVLVGETINQVFFGLPRLKQWEKILTGSTVTGVEARGKAMLTRFDCGQVIYSHNQLYGRWDIVAGDTWPESTRQLRLALHTASHVALLYSASDIDVLADSELSAHPYLRHLGPDLLDQATDVTQVHARLSEPRYRRRALVRLLQDQSVLAGMGTYLCCEVLHVAGVHPARRLVELSGAERHALASQCLALTRRSYATGGITNDPARAEALARAGHSFEERRFHVYRREGQACYRCGEPVLRQRISGQSIYFCPACQP